MAKKIYNFFLNLYYLAQAVFFFTIILPIFLIFNVLFNRIRLKFFKPQKPKILWAPLPIINIAYSTKADRLYGYRSDSLVYQTYSITSDKLFDYNFRRWYKIPFSFFIPPFIFLWATLKYDIFCFFYIGGFFGTNPYLKYIELPLLKLAGKKLIFIPYGSDVRTEKETRALGKYHAFYDFDPKEVDGLDDNKIKKFVNYCIRWADAPISMGDMTEYTPGTRNDMFFWTIDTKKWKPIFKTKNKEVVIVHATNHQRYKGSRFLFKAVERLKKEGYKVKLDMVEKMKNEEAKKHYEKADIFAEQFLIGWHGFTAIEAMVLGKPVLCYIRKKEYLPSWIKCPIINTNPDNLYQNLVKLVRDKKLRQKIGRDGRKFVEKVYSLESIGGRFNKLYQELWSK